MMICISSFDAHNMFVLGKHYRGMAITRVRSLAEPLVHGGAALAMPKFEHRKYIGRLKKPRGTVA